MTEPQACTLALETGEPDRVYPSLRALACALVKTRARLPHLIKTQAPPQLVAVSATLARSDLPGGSVVAIRARDGSMGGKGLLLGYVFMPGNGSGGDADRLMAAIVEAQAELDARGSGREAA